MNAEYTWLALKNGVHCLLLRWREIPRKGLQANIEMSAYTQILECAFIRTAEGWTC